LDAVQPTARFLDERFALGVRWATRLMCIQRQSARGNGAWQWERARGKKEVAAAEKWMLGNSKQQTVSP
jgi:hypothetical protein